MERGKSGRGGPSSPLWGTPDLAPEAPAGQPEALTGAYYLVWGIWGQEGAWSLRSKPALGWAGETALGAEGDAPPPGGEKALVMIIL